MVDVGGVGDLGGFVVAHFRRQGGYEHQGILYVPIDFAAINFDTVDHVFDVAVAGVGDEGDRMQEVVDDDRLVDVEFEVTLRTGEADGCGCAVNLDANHGHGLALRGIYFAGHDGGAGFVLRDGDFAKAATRAGSQPSDIVGNFHERGGQRFHCALSEDDFIVGGESGEFVAVGAEGKRGEFGDFFGGTLGEFGMGVETCAYGRAADGEIVEAVENLFQALDVAFEQTGPAAEFLAYG